MFNLQALIFAFLFSVSLNAFAGQYNTIDVTVPVPGSLGQAGTLIVTGTPGAKQSDKFYAAYCDSDAEGHLIQFGCKDLVTYSLNRDAQLSPGIYEVTYSNTTIWVQVVANQKIALNLQKIIVPPGRNVTFEVFVDYTNPAMQEKLIKNLWGYNYNRNVTKTVCASKSSIAKTACKAFQSNDPQNLLGTVVTFKTDGSYSLIVGSGDGNSSFTWDNPQRDMVTDPKAGEFVSVLPGVYAITFTDPQTKQNVTQYGIQVK